MKERIKQILQLYDEQKEWDLAPNTALNAAVIDLDTPCPECGKSGARIVAGEVAECFPCWAKVRHNERILNLEALLFECLPFVNEYMAGRIEPWISYETRKRIREKGKEPA